MECNNETLVVYLQGVEYECLDSNEFVTLGNASTKYESFRCPDIHTICGKKVVFQIFIFELIMIRI